MISSLLVLSVIDESKMFYNLNSGSSLFDLNQEEIWKSLKMTKKKVQYTDEVSMSQNFFTLVIYKCS
jgi:hypothetical protein